MLKALLRAKALGALTAQTRASAASCSMLTGGTAIPRLHPCSALAILTDALEDPLGLVLPPDPKQVKRNPAEDDGEADPAFLWCHPEGNSNEKQASQDEENGQADVHLNTDQRTGKNSRQERREHHS